VSTAHIQPETKERVHCRQASPPGAALSPASDGTVLSLDAFVRSIGVRRDAPFALFLGAGASTSSGLPSAQTCIWEWKRQIFLTNNPGLEERFAELSLDGVRRRIQQWLDRQGIYPKENAPEEYGFYIRQYFPIADDRRTFFAQKVRVASPHVGYRLLGLLAEADIVRSVWSPNFDGLAARAAAHGGVRLPAWCRLDLQVQGPAARRPSARSVCGGPVLKLPDSLKPLIKYSGVQLSEPELLFSSKAGTGFVRSAHPIRGSVENRPFDYSLTTRGFTRSIRLCPVKRVLSGRNRH
jgi:hypothetical protein